MRKYEIAYGVYTDNTKKHRGYICPFCGCLHYHGNNGNNHGETRMSHCDPGLKRGTYKIIETEKIYLT